MNISTVNELIQSLESAGELSIREQKFLKLAKAFKQLAAENVALKQIIDSVTNLDNEPQYHDEGMGCGLEDRGITDRYDACRYGWDEAMERIYGDVIPCAEEMDFSATDRIVAGIKADAITASLDACSDYLETDCVMDRLDISYEEAEKRTSGAIEFHDAMVNFANQMREGAK
ncbi:hypothetical protein [Klebsiella quasipneumoniae]|uniref:hypothetical protein n=1 Tax=Klebsiella quasipneumoniae TaxID=1463165 RepID=UPI0024811F65|nr:hypothetical protein [Klebsiella quasipneumoniae]